MSNDIKWIEWERKDAAQKFCSGQGFKLRACLIPRCECWKVTNEKCLNSEPSEWHHRKGYAKKNWGEIVYLSKECHNRETQKGEWHLTDFLNDVWEFIPKFPSLADALSKLDD
jgi:hypothetical protein